MPLAIIAFIVVMLIPMKGLSYPGHAAIALLVFAVIMWATEAVHLAVTSLIILFIQPIIGVESFDNAVIGFANPIIFLMIGGFIIAEAIRKSGLATRLTYAMLNKFGTSPDRSLFVAVFSTGLLSAWIENVVAFAMLLPIIKEIIPLMGVEDPEKGKSNFAKAMVLGASYGSLAGGFGTEIGTAPNLMAAAYTNIPFVNWMIFGFPLAIIMLIIIWKLLGRLFKPEVEGIVGGTKTITDKMESLGPMTMVEKKSLVILLFTISLWITTGITGLNSYSIALIGAVLFFIFKVIDWKDAQNGVDWGLIVFFGGALSLGAALLQTGAANWLITDIVALLGSNPSTILITVVLMIIAVCITQVMSNIALSAILIPLSVTLAAAQGQPVGTYAVPVAIACSLSFMLPMADPTVAMAYGTGYVKIKEILKAGVPLVVIGIILTIIILLTPLAKPALG
ncbi:DASS family sodium-coupled anion symporter [Methanobacterium subterraneum]|uniref:Anion transporter n=2 Tax=Methanobacterium subterraneum TaxID=59277 RepID=A0A2H4VSW1_9EURY|nr:DASS family sodium-coupled anion symporter [Methanobacterium subterraneum]AUB54978.1 anion transporter [Methanobacterium subterraneum]AUB61178.1 anion transporter [Methanobacterium subterraneum]MBW4256676.1 DASS family sodium-coupled anion symporter [Methanobacterium sp. YSL]NMO10078.1 DASS family sodium-coupled anion symporter [Methanobacterium subterraneum]